MADKNETGNIRQRKPLNIEDVNNKDNNSNDKNPSKIYGNLQLLRDKTELLKANLISTIDTKLSDDLDEFLLELERIEDCRVRNTEDEKFPYLEKSNKTNTWSNVHNIFHERKKERNIGDLPDKEFIARRSVLTELLDISHIRSIYHIFFAILIVFSLHTIIKDILENTTNFFKFDMIVWSFGKMPLVICLWIGMMLCSTAFLYPFFDSWGKLRKPGNLNMFDLPWMAIYGIYMIAFLVIPCYLVNSLDLPIASAIVTACEQVRLIMKQHAFIRENLERALETGIIPNFSKYLYFLFIPTLVYRDEYPRTKSVNWNYVVSNLLQVVACVAYIYFLLLRYVLPIFSRFSDKHMDPRNLILSCFGCMLPASLCLFIAFFAILHSWMNAWAEMLKFADRLFYRDWWNSTTFSNYYRTWNIVVHDWLFTYVYKDMVKIFGIHNRAASMSAVFLLSAVVHEFILIVSFGFFYPVLFVMFMGAGFGLMFIKGRNQKWNIGLWVALFMGTGILLCLYSLEWYARQTCPPAYPDFRDFIVPRSWTTCRN